MWQGSFTAAIDHIIVQIDLVLGGELVITVYFFDVGLAPVVVDDVVHAVEPLFIVVVSVARTLLILIRATRPILPGKQARATSARPSIMVGASVASLVARERTGGNLTVGIIADRAGA